MVSEIKPSVSLQNLEVSVWFWIKTVLTAVSVLISKPSQHYLKRRLLFVFYLVHTAAIPPTLHPPTCCMLTTEPCRCGLSRGLYRPTLGSSLHFAVAALPCDRVRSFPRVGPRPLVQLIHALDRRSRSAIPVENT